MARGSQILVSPAPRGRIIEGIINGTPLPGTVMQIDAAVEPVNGRHQWEPYGAGAGPGADGDRRLIAVLLEDDITGNDVDQAYTTGSTGRLYFPLPGDELNMRWSAAGTGAGDSVAIGDLAIVNDGDGLLIDTTGTPESEPFQSLETVSDVVATGTLVHCAFTGY